MSESLPTIEIHGACDGKLWRYDIQTRFEPEDKKLFFSALISLIRERCAPNMAEFGARGAQLISDSIGTAANYQAADRYYADDILAEICVFLAAEDDDDVVNTAVTQFSEQMRDLFVTHGGCSTGRVSRAMQIYMILADRKGAS